MIYTQLGNDNDPWQLKRRIVSVRINPELIGRLLCAPPAGELYTVEGIPHDAEVCGVAYEEDRDCFLIRYRHPSFPVVQMNAVIPERTVKVGTVAVC